MRLVEWIDTEVCWHVIRTLGHFLCQGAAVGVAVMILARLLSKRTARLRYAAHTEPNLKAGSGDFEITLSVNAKGRSLTLTDNGITTVEKRLNIPNLFDPDNIELLHHVNTAMRGHILFKRDQHYLVEDGKIVIVDEDYPRCSMASDISALVAEQGFDYLDAPPKRVSPPHTSVPYSQPLEAAYMPTAEKVVEAVREVMA